MSADRRYGERCPTGDRRWRSSTPSSRHWSRRTSTTSGYYSSRANADMKGSRQGLHAFLRGCYLNTSADWPGNTAYRLRRLDRHRAGQAAHLLRVMNQGDTMPEAGRALHPLAGGGGRVPLAVG